MKNTVIPFWVSSFRESKDKNEENDEIKTISEVKKNNSSFSNDKPEEMDKMTIRNNFLSKQDDKTALSTSSVDFSSHHTSAESKFDISTEVSVIVLETRAISEERNEYGIQTIDYTHRHSTSAITSSYESITNQTNISQEDKDSIDDPTHFTIHVKDENTTDPSIVHITEQDSRVNKTINSENVLHVPVQNNDVLERNNSVTSLLDYTATTSRNKSTKGAENDVDMTSVKHVELFPEIISNNIGMDSYEDTQDKTLEEIQDELIKLLDEMTQKYHNNTSVVV